jgi:hypothetical protein
MSEPGADGTSVAGAAERLNRECFCIAGDVTTLRSALERDLIAHGVAAPVIESHPYLFAAVPVFVAREHVDAMVRIAAAMERVATNPAYVRHALAHAPAIARRTPLAQGILQGFDFHLTADGPRLIEINTNAGGALLNVELIRAQRACCPAVAELVTGPNEADAADRIVAMFLAEWQRARGAVPLRRIAIVDHAPTDQYLFPEFVLFQRLFEAAGIATVISDPREFVFDGVTLRDARGPVDLVYNRLTDFYFDEPANAALRAAWLAGAVITPNPHEHALYASKRNLAALCDADRLRDWGVDPETLATLTRGIPHTELVQAEHAEALWAARDRLFFKPVSGFGSRGSYRGNKLTRKAFASILAGEYVAQAVVPPALRLHSPEAAAPLKFDVRLYTHRGEPLLTAARLYQGQTTNFRTPGGGFAPVYYPPGDECGC